MQTTSFLRILQSFDFNVLTTFMIYFAAVAAAAAAIANAAAASVVVSVLSATRQARKTHKPNFN